METETQALPPRTEMIEAFLTGDASYDGIFFTGVRTTGIFCRPTCAAKKPRPDNVVFFATQREAVLAGYRACKRCRPLQQPGATPAWVERLLDEVERDPGRRWRDRDLRALGLSPGRVRSWFQARLGMTFHGFSRARRLGVALGRIQEGDAVAPAAFSSGYDSLSAFNDAFKQVLGTTPSEARSSTVLVVTRIPTPLGSMVAAAGEDALWLLEFTDRRKLPTQLRTLQERHGCLLVPGGDPVLSATAEELDAYFAGRLRRFSIPVRAPGTPFQEAVWTELVTVPWGATTTYAELAGRLGRPGAARAVGRANGDNRVAILLPCHRVVGSDGRLTGYGGGLWRKRRLLELEGAGTAV
jgi:AraC family transcriptional regulator of adaptative response/methylated-DNA-[protein]-cysteine methyltransferase